MIVSREMMENEFLSKLQKLFVSRESYCGRILYG